MTLLQRRPGLAIRGYSYPYDEVGIYPPRSRGPDLREKRLGNRPITDNLAAVICQRQSCHGVGRCQNELKLLFFHSGSGEYGLGTEGHL